MKNFLKNLKTLLKITQTGKNNFGLTDSDVKVLKNIFEKYGARNVYIFGSRARGDYKRYSDIDLFVKDKIPKAQKAKLSLELQESSIPYTIDLVFFDELQSDKLKQEVDYEGILFN